jgi:hypothetical protein
LIRAASSTHLLLHVAEERRIVELADALDDNQRSVLAVALVLSDSDVS